MSLCSDDASVLKLIYMNIRWYMHSVHNLMLKYKIAVVFLILLLMPSITIIEKALVYPVRLYLFSDTTSFESSLLILLGFGVIFILYGAINRNILVNREWDNYLLSLPIYKHQKLINDFFLLTFINALFLMSIICGYFSILHSGSESTLMIACKAVILVIMLFIFQLLTIYKKWKSLFFLALLFAILTPITYCNSKTAIMLYMFFVFLCVSHLTWKIYGYSTDKNLSRRLSSFIVIRSGSKLISLVQLIFKIILHEFHSISIRILSMSLITCGILILSSLNDIKKIILFKIILLSVLINYIIVSCNVSVIDTRWLHYNNYLASLPIINRDRYISMYFATFLCWLPWGILNIMLMCILGWNHGLIDQLYLYLAIILFQGAIFLMQILTKKFSLLLSIIFLFPYFYYLQALI